MEINKFDKLIDDEKIKMEQNSLYEENQNQILKEIIDDYLKNLQNKVIQDVLSFQEIENKAQFESIGILDNQHEDKFPEKPKKINEASPIQFLIKVNDKDDSIVTIKEIHIENKSDRTETLKLGENLEDKINKLIFKEIKEEELNFIQRKVSQEMKNKRHSIHHKRIISGVSNISKIQKEEEIVVGRSRRSSSVESISPHAKRSNESTGMSKFRISVKKKPGD